MLFTGKNQSAHLFRDYSKLYLYIIKNNTSKILTSTLESKDFDFSWKDYKVNDVKMKVAMSNTDVIDTDLKFNALTFISPFIVIYDHLVCSTEQVYSCEEEAEVNDMATLL